MNNGVPIDPNLRAATVSPLAASPPPFAIHGASPMELAAVPTRITSLPTSARQYTQAEEEAAINVLRKIDAAKQRSEQIAKRENTEDAIKITPASPVVKTIPEIQLPDYSIVQLENGELVSTRERIIKG